MDQTRLFETPFFSGTKQEAVARVLQVAEEHFTKTLVVFTPNTEQLMLAEKDPKFSQELNQSDLNLPDSHGIVWAGSQLNLKNFPTQRIAGREFVAAILPSLAAKKRRVFLLGGFASTAERAAEELHLMFPQLLIEWSSGAADVVHETPEELRDVLKKIDAFHPDVLLVAYGAPYQERWILQHRSELNDARVKVAMVVGGTLDLLAGNVKPVPHGIASAHLEWLWRLMQQPSRLKRQLVLVSFVSKVLQEKSRARRAV